MKSPISNNLESPKMQYYSFEYENFQPEFQRKEKPNAQTDRPNEK